MLSTVGTKCLLHGEGCYVVLSEIIIALQTIYFELYLLRISLFCFFLKPDEPSYYGCVNEFSAFKTECPQSPSFTYELPWNNP